MYVLQSGETMDIDKLVLDTDRPHLPRVDAAPILARLRSIMSDHREGKPVYASMAARIAARYDALRLEALGDL